MSKLLASFVAVLGLFTLSSCGDASSASPVGTYTLDKAAFKESMMANAPKEGGEEAKKMMDEMFGKFEGTLELKADNTGTMVMKTPNPVTGAVNEEKHEGTWKLDGTKITFNEKDSKPGDENKSGTYANGVITFEGEENGMKIKMIFRRK